MNAKTGSSYQPWNKGKLVGQKTPQRLRDIRGIRIRLELAQNVRDLALFELARVGDQLIRAAWRFMNEAIKRGQRGLCIEINEQGADVGIGAERAKIGSDRGFTGSAFGRQDCCDFHDACL